MNATLQTERLLLRLCTVDDLDLFTSTWGDAEVMQTFGPGVPVLPEYIEQHLNEYIEGYQAGQRLPWALILRENDEKIGFGYLRWEDDECHTLSIGYLIQKAYWGNGYATEFAKAAVKFGISELNPYQIIATVIPDHVASRRVLKKAGLSYSHNISEWNRNLYAIKNPARADE